MLLRACTGTGPDSASGEQYRVIKTGVSSITLRRYGISEAVAYVADAKLQVIEWTADPHVPHGDLNAAREAAQRTADAGLQLAGYGSYYRCGEPTVSPPFEQVLETAEALGAPSVRVFAGRKQSTQAPPTYWKTVTRDLERVAALASDAGRPVSVEFMDHTLNDCPNGWKQLLATGNFTDLTTYWQPTAATEEMHRIDVVNELIKHIGNIHVFVWDHGVRVPLARGAREWLRVIELLADDTRREHCLLLQLVEKDRPENFMRDAETLRDIVSQVRV